MQQIFPGLYVVTRTAVNCYLIESAADELTVIDAGMPGMSSAILKAAAQLNYEPQQIKQILVTHSDIDHIGSLAALVKKTGAKVYAGKHSKPYIESGSTPPHVPSFMKLLNVLIKKSSVDHVFDDNDVLPIAGGIRILYTPGHTPDNYTFLWEKERVLFAADVFFALGQQVTLSPRMITWDSDKLKESAARLLNLAPKYICAGHGAPVNLAQYPDRVASVRRVIDGGATLAAT